MNDQSFPSVNKSEIKDKISNQMTSKVISKEELFSNKKALEIDTSDLEYPQEIQNNDENNKNQTNTNPQFMNYYYFNNQMNNNQLISQNPFQQQNYMKNMRNPQYHQQQYPRYNQNQYNNTNTNYNRNANPYNVMYGNKVYQSQNEVDELSIIQSLKFVSEKYPHLITLNQINTGILNKVRNQVSPRFFVIKSFTEEDIHKSIKYNCWSSTKEGNKKLTNFYNDCRSKNSDLFLFFSMNGSGRFVGVAKMMSEVDENMIFEYWAMDDVWKGLFQVEWVFIKDVPNKFLKDIKLSNNAFKPVTNSRDTQEIPRAEGEAFLKVFEEFKYHTCILQHFQYYDERQDLFEKTRIQK